MKKILAVLALLVATPSLAAELKQFQPGPRLIDGTQLNSMVNRINNGFSCSSYVQKVAAASLVDEVFFVATRGFKVKTVSALFSTSNGATLTAQLSKDTGTNAPGAGTDLLSTAFDLNLTANTVQVGTLVTTDATITMVAGDRLSIDFSAAGTSIVGAIFTACLAPN